MKIVFINRYFYPDHAATSQLLSDLAFALAQQQERQVCVVTSRQRYDDPQARLANYECIDGVSVYRAWSTRFGRANLAGRALDYLSFYLGAGWTLARIARRGDVIVAKTDPPLISVVAAVVSAVCGARLINWLQDLFPEVAAGLWMSTANAQSQNTFKSRLLAAAYRLLQKLRDRSLLHARYNVVIGDLMRERLLDLGIAAAQIRVVHNWADGKAIRPLAAEENPLRKEWLVADKFVVGYSGNLGRAHEIDTLLAAMELLRGDARIVFLLIGGGAQWQRLRDECERRGLCNVLFKPYQPRANLRFSLSVADVHLVMLQPQMEGLIVPSKFYGIAAAGRPCIYIGALYGEIPAILHAADSGIIVAPGDGQGLAAVLRRLISEPQLCKMLGDNARTVFEQRFEQRLVLRAWQELLDVL